MSISYVFTFRVAYVSCNRRHQEPAQPASLTPTNPPTPTHPPTHPPTHTHTRARAHTRRENARRT
jgi:hypothetical protein